MDGRKSTAKLSELRKIEQTIQAQWEAERVFELDADTSEQPQEKYLVTFPYPYMNGQLHLGHVFSLSKNEFAIGFERLRGRRALWPFGLHCTGMPIKASADKLVREMELYGYPPSFPPAEDEDQQEPAAAEPEAVDPNAVNKAKGKKSKAAAKAGGASYQWQIMQSMGLSHAEIRHFTSPAHWLRHFPPLCVRDLKALGTKIDWRRSFITTDANPYYDAFVRWHFFRLKDDGRVKFGKRYTVFSPKDQQPCMDHDRSSGEGVGPQEYTLVKMQLLLQCQPDASEAAAALATFKLPGDARVHLVAGTLRPETMYGLTNCWIHPDIAYLVVESAVDKEYLVCTRRAARNMLYQGILAHSETLESIESPHRQRILGAALIGCPLSGPLTPYQRVYLLPMLTIKEAKGTGIVASVPSDSPDDYVALTDLGNKAALRDKYGVRPHMLLEPLPIIDIPELGDLAAVTLAKEMKIQSQNDREKLDIAKERVYKLGFYDGVLKVGDFAGSKVQEVKKKVQQLMLDAGQAIVYMEPEREVKSRSGDECVVALCDQWYLDYGDPEWKATARKALDQLNTFGEEVKNNFAATLDWLVEHACSRSFGLGTKLPWDPQYLIESLSDSTVYMAYYTVCHLLHRDLYGLQPGELGVTPDQMTPDVWDYVFCISDTPPSQERREPKPPPPAALERMRREFSYWYPVDLRTSGKDLVPNHLTYYLYNHCSVWRHRPDLWPRAVRANGHVLLNGLKMSKSTGNFLSLDDAIEKFSADGLRLALADAGDGIEDANFVEKMADSSLLRLYAFADWVKEVAATAAKGELRSGAYNEFSDAAFEAEIDWTIGQVHELYARMHYKEVVKTGVFEFMAMRDRYAQLCADSGMHCQLILRYIETQLVLLSPLCPHICDHLWRNVLAKPASILHERWPQPSANSSAEAKQRLLDELHYLVDSSHEFRLRMDKFLARQKCANPTPATHANVWVVKSYPAWQAAILELLKRLKAENAGELPDNKTVAVQLRGLDQLKGKAAKKAMPFVAMVKEQPDRYLAHGGGASQVDELRVLRANAEYLRRTLKLESLTIGYAEDSPSPLPEEGTPGQPLIFYATKQCLPALLVNPVPANGQFAVRVPVYDGDTAACLLARARRQERCVAAAAAAEPLRLYRYADGLAGVRAVPKTHDALSLVPLPEAAVFHLDVAAGDVLVAVAENGAPGLAKHWASQLVYNVLASS